jgi:hypothetical protein
MFEEESFTTQSTRSIVENNRLSEFHDDNVLRNKFAFGKKASTACALATVEREERLSTRALQLRLEVHRKIRCSETAKQADGDIDILSEFRYHQMKKSTHFIHEI